jgi:hypothetical protein
MQALAQAPAGAKKRRFNRFAPNENTLGITDGRGGGAGWRLRMEDEQRPDEGAGQDDFEGEEEDGVREARHVLDELHLRCEEKVLVGFPP